MNAKRSASRQAMPWRGHWSNLTLKSTGKDLCRFSVFRTTGKQPACQQAQGTGLKANQSLTKQRNIHTNLSSLRDIMMTFCLQLVHSGPKYRGKNDCKQMQTFPMALSTRSFLYSDHLSQLTTCPVYWPPQLDCIKQHPSAVQIIFPQRALAPRNGWWMTEHKNNTSSLQTVPLFNLLPTRLQKESLTRRTH